MEKQEICTICSERTELDYQFTNICKKCLKREKEHLNRQRVYASEDFFCGWHGWKITPAELKKNLNRRKDL